jgi:hypothetical protein
MNTPSPMDFKSLKLCSDGKVAASCAGISLSGCSLRSFGFCQKINIGLQIMADQGNIGVQYNSGFIAINKVSI